MSYRVRPLRPQRRGAPLPQAPKRTRQAPANRQRRGGGGDSTLPELSARNTRWSYDWRAAQRAGNWAALLLLMRFPWAPADAATRALPAACRQAAGSAILDALLAAGADVTSRNDGELPCVEAARGGDAETIRWLLEHGADVDEADRFANTP